MADKRKELEDWLYAHADTVELYQAALCALRAVGPENGGQGEMEKAEWIENELMGKGFSITRLNAPDKRVVSGFRPNLLAHRKGRHKKTLWLFGHMDVVPEGDLSCWHSDPWRLKKSGDLLFGRGVEDNQQAICSMLLLANALHDLNIDTEYSLGLVFMSDEEHGSDYGLKWILSCSPELFSPEDLYIVPDGGSFKGDKIEIAEKAQLWLKFTVLGKQCHASIPHAGKNSLFGASYLILKLNALHDLFPESNPLFRPSNSTFTPTRHEENVGAINILPGKDIFYLDCRLLPEIEIERVKKTCEEICATVASELDLEIRMDVTHCQKASHTSPDAPVIKSLKKAIEKVYAVKASAIGIGGATVAAMLREKGLAAVVWSRIRNTCHQPDECSSISDTCGDAAVFGNMLFGNGD